MAKKSKITVQAKAVPGSPHVKTNASITQVERMAACGLDESEIAYCLGTDPLTVRTMYSEQITMGLAAVTAKVGGAMIKSALRGDTNAGQFILRSRARWVTPTKIEQDVSVTVTDKRNLMDQIVDLVQKAGRAPVTIEHQEQVKKLEKARAPEGAKPS